MNDPMARGGVRRYLDTVAPAEYYPDVGEVDLSEMTLTGLCDLYGSDKGNIKHRYTEVYERIIMGLIGRAGASRKHCNLRIVEAGVACGASLRALAQYLPASQIFGYDIRPECSTLCVDQENVQIIIGDPASLRVPDVGVDIFIDDASHISENILNMFENCWPWLNPGGYYVIEDLRCTYNDAYTQQFRDHFDPTVVNSRDTIMNMVDAVMRVVDERGDVSEFSYYPQMLVIQKTHL